MSASVRTTGFLTEWKSRKRTRFPSAKGTRFDLDLNLTDYPTQIVTERGALSASLQTELIRDVKAKKTWLVLTLLQEGKLYVKLVCSRCLGLARGHWIFSHSSGAAPACLFTRCPSFFFFRIESASHSELKIKFSPACTDMFQSINVSCSLHTARGTRHFMDHLSPSLCRRRGLVFCLPV